MVRHEDYLPSLVLAAILQQIQPGLDLSKGEEVVRLVNQERLAGLEFKHEQRVQHHELSLPVGEFVECQVDRFPGDWFALFL